MNVRKNSRKKWTVLIYANGNNELEPEIYSRIQSLQEEVEGEGIYIVIQLARMSTQRLKLLRPKLKIGKEWTGVRRFVLKEGKNTLVGELGKVNMADPFTLYHFITWGITHYPAENVMLILSGHGAGFIGLMTDYTQDKPYIMTIKGFTNALYLSRRKTGKAIDCILLDTCYMNMVELWHELACIPKNTVKYILAPIQNIALEGIPYPMIIKLLETNTSRGTHEALKIITKAFNEFHGMDSGLLLVRAKKRYFTMLKQVVNEEVKQLNKNRSLFIYQLNKRDPKIYREPLLSLIVLEELLKNNLYEIKNKEQKITKILKNIIIEPPIENIPSETSIGPSLYFPFNLQQYEDIKNIYKRLRFSYDNEWVNIIEGKEVVLQQQQARLNYNFLPPPMVIPIKNVVATILQQNIILSQQKALEIVKQLGWW